MADIDTVCWELNEQGLGDRVLKIINRCPEIIFDGELELVLSQNFCESLTVRPGRKTVENPNRTDELRSFNRLLTWKCNYYIRNR